MSDTPSESQVVEMKGTEVVFKVTDPVPPEVPSASTYLNSQNSYQLFLDKDKYKRDVFNQMKLLNRELTRAFLVTNGTVPTTNRRSQKFMKQFPSQKKVEDSYVKVKTVSQIFKDMHGVKELRKN